MLWTHARIEKLIATMSDEIAQLKKEGNKPRPIDFSYYLSRWATDYGFYATEVKAQFDAWERSVGTAEDPPYRRPQRVL